MGILGDKYTLPLYHSMRTFYERLENFLALNVKDENDIIYVDAEVNSSGSGKGSWANAKATIQEGVNAARYDGTGATIDSEKGRNKYVLIRPGQYNEQVLWSAYNVHVLGITGGAVLSNKDYGVTLNYDGAIDTTAVMGFTGAGIEIAFLTFHCNEAIPALYIPTPGDGCWIHHNYFTGDDSKTSTIAISGNSIKTTRIEHNIIEGFTTGIDVGIDGGAWFYNSVIRDNIITKVTNIINVNAGAVAGQSAIIDNQGVGSSTGIVNATATDILITGNKTKPALSDGGSTAGDNTTLS
jgi:hypothetical protein